jgi:hypothetical protein
MKRDILNLAIVLFSACFITAPSARSSDIKITLTKVPVEPGVLTRNDACIRLPLTSIDKMPDYKFPKPVCSKPAVFYLDDGDKKHVFMKDVDKPESKVYNRLYYDSDHDKDLSDEEPIPLDLKVIGRGYYQQFSVVELDLDAFGHKMWKFRTTEGSFALDNERHVNRYKPRMNLQFKDALSGNFTLDDTHYSIDFFDVQTDGNISSITSTNRYRTCDIMRIARKADAPEKEIKSPFGNVPEMLVIDNHSFYVKPGPDGKSCTLKEITKEGSGLVNFPEDTLYTLLKSEQGSVLVSEPEGDIRLPPGKYTAQNVYLMRRDKNGRPWIIRESKRKQTSVTVTADATSKIDIGGPFTLACSMRKSRREGFNSYPCISFSDKNGKGMSTDIIKACWPKATRPTYKLINSAGDEVRLGKMGYG